MGMYTQAKGMLNVKSIGGISDFDVFNEKLKNTQNRFILENEDIGSWVCENTHAVLGGNGSVFIFFGTELKNYNNEIRLWIDYLLKEFPTAEGKFDIQYEEFDYPTTLFVYSGKIVKQEEIKVKQNGYGNGI